jgi:putative tryptophan/tyrosine transport system substrate-binding protein
MKRRDLLGLIGGAAVLWPLPGQAQQPALPVVGLLDVRSPEPIADRLRAFRQGLEGAGYVEGENVAITYRWAKNNVDRVPELVAIWFVAMSP